MPELPDVTLYVESLHPRVVGATLERMRIASPFVLRSVAPDPEELRGRTVREVRRLGKRIVFAFDEELFALVHLMIAGRFRWEEKGKRVPGKVGLLALDFSTGTLILTEVSQKKRASLFLLRGEADLASLFACGLEVLDSSLEDFDHALRRENHTIKRAMTDPRILSGIGNAYSDEILHRARLSPVRLTRRMTGEEMARLHDATRTVLSEWIDRLRTETGDRFPTKVTAFRPEMAVHGRYRQPCPDCGAPVQRIVHAENESNYCARCQTNGKLLADRSLSRLLKGDWPRSLEELEEMQAERVRLG